MLLICRSIDLAALHFGEETPGVLWVVEPSRDSKKPRRADRLVYKKRFARREGHVWAGQSRARDTTGRGGDEAKAEGGAYRTTTRSNFILLCV
ncbi:hypothetical protein KOW79_009681 [Hemibagrus wyckioides]|uniref:Uncharacterized protein n=1 Tax=Hemibagrus wyckioides TaxID=337641 RepID=A0A9D3NSH0_9TELE|nr:hypothetical protein KOW79_009681 [Hemibagrus wyckioides]